MSSHFIPGNRVTLLQNGNAYFSAIESSFDQAKHEIFIETYIFKNDATGLHIEEVLKRAVLRGVDVYILIDGYGSKNLPKSVLDRLQTAGIRVLIFRPKISPWTFKRKRLRRMHRKVVVVDQEVAFVGGINIVSDQNDIDGKPCQYDFAIATQGPLVQVIRQSVRRLWFKASLLERYKSTAPTKVRPVSISSAGGVAASFLVRDNFRHRRDIEAAYMDAIKHADREIILAHAYFLPGLEFRHALIEAAARGVRVTLLLQGRLEYYLEYYASRTLYGNLLEAGIEIYEYRQGFLHAKVAVIDGHWMTVGSSNIDPFSLLLSREANIVIEDKAFSEAFAEKLKETIEMDSRQVVAESWRKQPIGMKIMGWICYGSLRFMMLISGYERTFHKK